MAGYKLQGKTSDGRVVDIPLAATYDANGNDIAATYITKDEAASEVTARESADTALGVRIDGTETEITALKTGKANTSGTYCGLNVGHASTAAEAEIAQSAGKLANAYTIDGIRFDGSASITHYGVCSTAAATAAKIVTLSGFTLVVGARIAVKFSYTNNAFSPTLNVNGTGAKSIYFPITTTNTKNVLRANSIIEFIYDGTKYVMVSGDALDAYPVGSIYISVNSTSPAGLFGGSWEKIADKFLIGAGGSYSLGATGGTITHDHVLGTPDNTNAFALAQFNYKQSNNAPVLNVKEGNYTEGYIPVEQLQVSNHFTYTENITRSSAVQVVGKTKTANTLPPYLAVNIWKRTA